MINATYAVCEQLTSELLSDDEKIEILRQLSQNIETAEDLIGMAQYLRERSVKIPTCEPNLLDVCGTGGSGLPRMNTSTTVAFLLASMGVKVAKHGNRAMSGKCGSFDVLESLGIPVIQSPATISTTISNIGLGFIYAPSYHPALKNISIARKKYGKRTIFNLLGPLLNPTNPEYQLIGTTKPYYAEIITHACIKLGSKKVTVVCGEDGLDEITLAGKTTIFSGDKNGIVKTIFDPRDIGIARTRSSRYIDCGYTTANAQLMLQLLSGKGPQLLHELTCINAAFALVTCEKFDDLIMAYKSADSTLKSGQALNLFNEYKKLAKQLTK